MSPAKDCTFCSNPPYISTILSRTSLHSVVVDQLPQARGQGHRRPRPFGGIALASEDAATVVVATEVVRALPLANLLTGRVGFR